MQGKIAIEEHFAADEPDRDTTRRLETAASWANTARRLPEFHDLRLKDMDACGIEYAILSLDTPALRPFGVRITDLPVTPARLHALIKQARGITESTA